jgi:HAD superfamily hydrolase (TIGR01509 family)
MSELRALFVDVGGVLVDDRKWPAPGDDGYLNDILTANLCEAFGQEHPWFEALLRLRFADPCAPDWRQRTLDVLQAKLCELGADLCDDDLRRVCRAYVIPMQHAVPLEPGAVEAMREACALGLRLAICSNTLVRCGEDYRKDMEHYGIADCFEAYITSLDVGYGKPHPAMFEAALAALGTRPEETAMLGDRLDRDIVGARALRIRTIWRRLPDVTATPDPVPDAEIATLWELGAVLQRWVRDTRSSLC